MEKRRLRENILDQIEAKDLKTKDVTLRTGIPEAYLTAIIEDRRDKLPAFPYIRPYLVKVAQLLGLNPGEVITQYKAEFSNKISGIGDTLPPNRFALPSNRRRYLIGAGILVLIIFGYAISNSGFFGRPHLVITMPPAGASPYVTNISSVTLTGQIDAGDKLLINNQLTPVSNEGLFSLVYPLNPELNTIEFKVQRFLGKEIIVVRHIYYERATSTLLQSLPEQTETSPPTTSTETE